ncbi:MAG: PEP-CTERM sorting domain-containing protein [Planctomycetota bacterium]
MKYALIAATAFVAAPAMAGLVDTQSDNDAANSNVVDDGVINPGEYSATYTGGGSGFGGPLGGGSLSFDADSSNLYIGFEPQAGWDGSNNVVLFLDTRPGGVTDDTSLSDMGDPGRNLSSNLTRDVQDNYAIGADFSVVIGGFGVVVFELADDGTGALVFTAFEGDQVGGGASETTLSLAALGATGTVDFFAAFGSDTNFISNETIPASPSINGGNNPGFDNDGTGNPVDWVDFNRFNIPAPGAVALFGLGGLAAARRRR